MLRVAGLSLAAATCLFAQKFAPPAEGPVAFRRDRIPLDAEAMAGLSRQLATLAEGLDFKTAANRRAAAQMLALAVTLDPANSKTRELIARFQAEKHLPPADPQEAGRAREQIWQHLTWLETPESGTPGQALAACLTDVMLVSDPAHPRAEALRAAGERGAWQGWIPELGAYETVAAVKPKPPEEVVAAVPAKPGILLSKARVFTPLWKNVGNDESMKWVLCRAPLQMSAAIIPAGEGESSPFSVTIGATNDDHRLSRLHIALRAILKQQHGSLPAGGRVTITSSALETSLKSNKSHAISAAAAVLASSAISGREPDATIIGLIDESGAFKLPQRFWEQLTSLGPGQGGRLVLPAAAAAYLPSMLALENPGFFLEYEVLLASNFRELLDLTEKSPSENLEKTSAQFREIREKATSQVIGNYLSNSFVRRRLEELAQQAPYHYSAKMLALQGSGNRPAYISRAVLAAELRRVIEPLDWLAQRDYYSLSKAKSDQLRSAQDTFRSEADRLFRCTEKGDRQLLARAQEIATAIRTLERTLKTRDEFNAEGSEGSGGFSAYSALARVHAEITAELATAIGNPEAASAR